MGGFNEYVLCGQQTQVWYVIFIYNCIILQCFCEVHLYNCCTTASILWLTIVYYHTVAFYLSIMKYVCFIQFQMYLIFCTEKQGSCPFTSSYSKALFVEGFESLNLWGKECIYFSFYLHLHGVLHTFFLSFFQSWFSPIDWHEWVLCSSSKLQSL